MIDFQQQLYLHAAQYGPVVKGDSCWIKCPFHGDGQERTPSCRINLQKGKYPVGYFYCYGCGTYGLWNKLAEAIPGLTKLEGEELKRQELLMTRLTSQQKDSLYGIEVTNQIDFDMMVPWSEKENWRSINGQILHKLKARKYFDRAANTNQIFLPCYQNDQLKGGIRGRMEKDPTKKHPSYINTAGPWVKSTWYPYDYVRDCMNTDIIAVVEGPRDALNMIQHGFPAVALLGSHNWSKFKGSMLQILEPKVVVMALDPDEAGQLADQEIRLILQDACNLIKIDFPEGKDPGDLTGEQIKRLYSKIKNQI